MRNKALSVPSSSRAVSVQCGRQLGEICNIYYHIRARADWLRSAPRMIFRAVNMSSDVFALKMPIVPRGIGPP